MHLRPSALIAKRRLFRPLGLILPLLFAIGFSRAS